MENKEVLVTARCPIRTTMELISGKWKLIILHQLYSHDELRLSELKRLIPDISEKMLIQELKTLVMNDLAVRRNYGEVPPRVGYSITENGKLARPLINQMIHFAKQYESRRFINEEKSLKSENI